MARTPVKSRSRQDRIVSIAVRPAAGHLIEAVDQIVASSVLPATRSGWVLEAIQQRLAREREREPQQGRAA